MKRSKFFTQTRNTKGKEVRTGNGSLMAEATLGMEPNKNDESFDSPNVRVRITETKSGELVIAIRPKLLTRYRILLENGAKPQIIHEGSRTTTEGVN